MIICFEGPEGSGKTTQVEMLYKHIKEKYPEKKVVCFKFPNKARTDINTILSATDELINPYFAASAFLNDFYQTLNEERTNEYGVCRYIDWVKDPNNILILDRYYYSSFVMCKGWANKYDISNEKLAKMSNEERNQYIQEAKDYVNDLRGTIVLLTRLFELPAPDLTYILLPSYDECRKRIEKREDNNAFDSEKMSKIFYNLYVESLVKSSNLYISNGEKLAPVIVRSENHIYINPINKLSATLDSKIIRTSKSAEEISKDIVSIFNNYLEIVDQKTTEKQGEAGDVIFEILKDLGFSDISACAIIGNIIKESLMNSSHCSNGKNFDKIDPEDDYGYGLFQYKDKAKKKRLVEFLDSNGYAHESIKGQIMFMMQENPNIRGFMSTSDIQKAVDRFKRYVLNIRGEDESAEDEQLRIKLAKEFYLRHGRVETDDSSKQSFIPSPWAMTVEDIKDDMAFAKETYKFTDDEMYVYNKFNMSADEIVKNPIQYVLGKDYNNKSRETVLMTLLKVLTNKDVLAKYKNKAEGSERYIRGLLESFKLENTEKVINK